MNLANPPKLFAATLLVIALLMVYPSILRENTRSMMTGAAKSRGPASYVKPIRAMVTQAPTAFPTYTPFPTPTVTPVLPEVDTLPPDLRKFVNEVANGVPNEIRGIYVAGIMSLPIVQQPKDNWAFVSDEPDTATLFQSAVQNGVTGLLAHNYLAGDYFYYLRRGSMISIVYGDKHIRRYQVSQVLEYQKLDLTSLTSDMIDLNTGKRLSSTDVFNRVYGGSHHVTLQTCLAKDGVSNWGLTFVIAEPVQ